jgi:hypothetical protein
MSHAGGSRGTQAAPGAAWKTGRFAPAPYNNRGSRLSTFGGQMDPVDWDSPASLTRFVGKAHSMVGRIDRELSRGGSHPGYYFDAPLPGHNQYRSMALNELIDKTNPFYSQGLGPASFEGATPRTQLTTHRRWYEAQGVKFQNRIAELGAIEGAPATSGFGAGTQGAYDEQQTARTLLGKPFPEAAAAAEQLRLERGGGSARRGGGVATSGRQGARATAAEQARLGRSQASGGSSPRRRLRASNLLAQPLGGGGYGTSARQLLG